MFYADVNPVTIKNNIKVFIIKFTKLLRFKNDDQDVTRQLEWGYQQNQMEQRTNKWKQFVENR